LNAYAGTQVPIVVGLPTLSQHSNLEPSPIGNPLQQGTQLALEPVVHAGNGPGPPALLLQHPAPPPFGPPDVPVAPSELYPHAQLFVLPAKPQQP
jgi:hypothetical protein